MFYHNFSEFLSESSSTKPQEDTCVVIGIDLGLFHLEDCDCNIYSKIVKEKGGGIKTSKMPLKVPAILKSEWFIDRANLQQICYEILDSLCTILEINDEHKKFSFYPMSFGLKNVGLKYAMIQRVLKKNIYVSLFTENYKLGSIGKVLKDAYNYSTKTKVPIQDLIENNKLELDFRGTKESIFEQLTKFKEHIEEHYKGTLSSKAYNI